MVKSIYNIRLSLISMAIRMYLKNRYTFLQSLFLNTKFYYVGLNDTFEKLHPGKIGKKLILIKTNCKY